MEYFILFAKIIVILLIVILVLNGTYIAVQFIKDRF